MKHNKQTHSFGEKNDLDTVRNTIGFWFLGVLNNFAYVVILSAAPKLADCFHQSAQMSLVTWSLVAAGFGCRILNMVLERSSFELRVGLTCLSFTIGYLSLAASMFAQFWLSIVAILFVGAGCSFGESCQLSYLKVFPTKLTGAWASGTGMAGVAGSLYFLGMFSVLESQLTYNMFPSDNPADGMLKTQLFIVFLTMVPSVVFYTLVFFCLLRHPSNLIKAGYSSTAPSKPTKNKQDDTENQPLLQHSQVAVNNQMLVTPPKQSFLVGMLSINKKVYGHGLILLLVYFFEYVISVGFAQVSNVTNLKRHPHDFFVVHAYTVLQVCYQVGVLISRSSLQLVRIRRTGVLTALQCANFVLWLVLVKLQVSSVWVQFVLMMWVGLMGGGGYVNCFANLVDDPNLANAEREKGINVVCLYMNVGIVASSVFSLIADHTFLSELITH